MTMTHLPCFRTLLARPVALAAAVICLGGPLIAAEQTAYAVSATFAVGGDGRWDYLCCDSTGAFLYVPRTSHTMILATATGATVADIPSTNGVHGVALAVPEGRGFTSNGTDGSSTIFDLVTHATLGTVKTAADADCIIYDPASHHVLAFCGDAKVMVPIAAAVTLPGASEPAVPLGGKPEFAAADGHGKVFVNLVDTNQVAVIDTTTMKPIAQWPTAPGTQPCGMAIDPVGHRLYVGCRNQKLIIMDSQSGAVLADLAIGPGVDATAFHRGLAFASCGDSTLSVVKETAPGTFSIVQTVHTAPGARTMAIDPIKGTLFMPSADFTPAPADQPRQRPKAVPGTFKIIVVTAPPT
jgi:DNA-binding beta-propeller fold protein YncE